MYVIAMSTILSISHIDCNNLSYTDRWIEFGKEVSAQCYLSRVNLKWWVIADPCQLQDATQLTCSSQSIFCMIGSEKYLKEDFNIVCCTDSFVTSFSTGVEYSCEMIRGMLLRSSVTK